MKKVFYMVCLLNISHGTSMEWIDPSEQICKKHGGEFNDTRGLCNASNEEAKLICQDVGGSLPTLDEIERLSTVCGSKLIYVDAFEEAKARVEKNKDNKAYQSCYQEKGFQPKYSYWTSTAHSVNDPSPIYVYVEEGVFDWYYRGWSMVRCIRISNEGEI